MVAKTPKSRKKKGQEPEDYEQRIYPRLKPSSVPFLKSVTSSQGTEIKVIDISRSGMGIETEDRLRPQMKITLKMVTTDGVIKIEGTILRCSISSLNGTPRYQSAIAFDHPFHMLDDLAIDPTLAISEPKPETNQPETVQESGVEPKSQSVAGNDAENPAIATLASPDLPDVSLLEEFKLNDW